MTAFLPNLIRQGSGIHKKNNYCANAFHHLKNLLLCSTPIMQVPNWSTPFRCHVDASQHTARHTLTQLHENGNGQVIAYFFKRLSPVEANYTKNNYKLLGSVYFLKRFGCYLENSEFEVVSDN